MRNYYIPLVREFNTAYGSDAPSAPALQLGDRMRLVRLQLDTEEAGELVHGMAARDLIECLDALTDLDYVVFGTFVAIGADRTGHDIPHIPSTASGPPRVVPADLGLILVGQLIQQVGVVAVTLATGDWGAVAGANLILAERLTQLWGAFRIPEELRWALFQEVHRSNMTKFDADGRPVLNAAGRVVKGPNYEEPRLLEVLEAHGYSVPAPNPEPGSPLSGAVLVYAGTTTPGVVGQTVGDTGAPRTGAGRPSRSERHPDEGRVVPDHASGPGGPEGRVN